MEGIFSDIENGLVGEGESGTNGERSIDIYTLPSVKWIARKWLCNAGGLPGALGGPSVLGWEEVGEAQEEGEICVMMADLHCCTAEANRIL